MSEMNRLLNNKHVFGNVLWHNRYQHFILLVVTCIRPRQFTPQLAGNMLQEKILEMRKGILTTFREKVR